MGSPKQTSDPDVDSGGFREVWRREKLPMELNPSGGHGITAETAPHTKLLVNAREAVTDVMTRSIAGSIARVLREARESEYARAASDTERCEARCEFP